jgi:hypothetical protein
MSMVDRYKKSGGFLQLVQVIETCGKTKREQFMKIITEESPGWAEALNQKSLSFDKIISWSPEILLEILAHVNPLTFATAIKSLEKEKLEAFLGKLSHQEKRRLEGKMLEGGGSPNEVSSSMMKVVSETRLMLASGALKADKIDPDLVIPDEFENKLERKGGSTASNKVDVDSILADASAKTAGGPPMTASASNAEINKLQQKLILVTRELQSTKNENILMKDKLEKIKKIA